MHSILRALLTLIIAGAAHALESGAMIPTGAPDGLGPLSTYGVVNVPLGTARITGGQEPDLFVATGRHGMKKGLYLYHFVKRGDRGEPVFALHGEVGHPFETPYPPSGAIFQTKDGTVHALWPSDSNVMHCVLNADTMMFEEKGTINVTGLPRTIRDLGAMERTDGSILLLFGVSDGAPAPQSPVSSRSPEYDPYDGRGIWRFGMPYVGLYAARLPDGFNSATEPAYLVSSRERDVRIGYYGFAPVQLREGHAGVIAGSHYGEFHYVADPTAPSQRKHLVARDGIALRHPSIHPAPTAFPNAAGTYTDLIAAGEGALYWYRFLGHFTPEGKPVFDVPVPVLEEKSHLYAGTLPVTNVVDWDGDGDKDIVAGNSEGFILFIENDGSNVDPKFLPGIPLEAGGQCIHIQPGYGLDIQGPQEARWGYVCPTVVDWDQDGDLDIVMSDSTARHTYFENTGSTAAPQLATGTFLYYDGLDLYGTWRVQPGVGVMDGGMAYIALDGDDEFHLYWQEDERHVTEGFKLQLATGEVMKANFLHAGGSGRLKIVLTDWDQDGVKDLIVGTPRHGSVPDPDQGLPQSLGLPGSSILFIKNVGTENQPRYNRPELFAFKGKPIYLGQHACSPAVADFGNPNGPDLIAGEESGRFYFYNREDLTTMKADEIGEEFRGRKD